MLLTAHPGTTDHYYSTEPQRHQPARQSAPSSETRRALTPLVVGQYRQLQLGSGQRQHLLVTLRRELTARKEQGADQCGAHQARTERLDREQARLLEENNRQRAVGLCGINISFARIDAWTPYGNGVLAYVSLTDAMKDTYGFVTDTFDVGAEAINCSCVPR